MINLNFATTQDEHTENRDHSRGVFITLSALGAATIILASVTLARDYLGYTHLEHALTAVTTQTASTFINETQAAVATAGNIDVFNRYAAIGELEQLLASLQTNNGDITDTEHAHSLQAINYAQKAVKIDPYQADNYLTLAQTYQDIYAYSDETSQITLAEQIRAAYAQAALLQPTNPDILLALGGFYQSVGELDQAQQFYQQALTINPDYALSNYQLATLYEQKGNLELARSTYRNTLELLDQHADNYDQNKTLLEQKLEQLTQN